MAATSKKRKKAVKNRIKESKGSTRRFKSRPSFFKMSQWFTMHNLESIQLLIFSGLDSKLQEIGLKTWYFGKRNNKNSGRFA